jgi:16S rRNA processing protein RimM
MERRSQADPHQFFVGTVVGFHSLAGEVKIRTSTNSPDLLVDVQSVRVEFEKGMVTEDDDYASLLNVRTARIDKRMLMMTFKGLNDRSSVEHLEGAKLFCKEEELLPLEEEEFWVSDLVGMEVFTTDGAAVGRVVSIINAGNDLLEITPIEQQDGKTILIPFVKDVVPVVDAKKKRIEVIDVPGLLEPQ